MVASVVTAQVLSMISMLIQAPVLYWHLAQQNIATVCAIVWLVLLNLNTFISTLVWRTDDTSTWWDGKGYGDVFVRIVGGGSIGILCATTAIARGLSIILSRNGPTVDPSSFHRKVVDLAICLVPPVLYMALMVVVMPRRYALYQYQGPNPHISESWPSIVIYVMPQLLFALVALAYAALALVRYWRKRQDYKDLLHTTNSGLSTSRFLRMLVFESSVVVILFPLAVIVFANNIRGDWSQPYRWAAHSAHFHDIPMYPQPSVNYTQWVFISVGFLQFACFGTGKELVALYSRVATAVGLSKLTAKLPCPRRSSRNRDSQLAMLDLDKQGASQHSRQDSMPSPGEMSEFTVNVTHHNNYSKDPITDKYKSITTTTRGVMPWDDDDDDDYGSALYHVNEIGYGGASRQHHH